VRDYGTELRQRLRALIEGREIECDSTAPTWAGPSETPRRCAGCTDLIPPGEVEVEVEIPALKKTVFFHVTCHTVWLEVCRELGHSQ
jgi:hypothetical protein